MTPDDIKQAQAAMAFFEELSSTSDYQPKNLGNLIWDPYGAYDHRPAIREALSFYAKYLAVKDTHRMVERHPSDPNVIRAGELQWRYENVLLIFETMLSASNDPMEGLK